MKHSLPLISVVLCTYNGEKFIREQIETILAQSWANLELIVADDASIDSTVSIIQQFASDPRMQLHVQPKNIALGKNFMQAASKARGEWIAFSDQDDIWLPHKLETLFREKGNYPLVYSNSLLVNEAGVSMGKTLADFKRMYTGDDSRGGILYSCVWGHGMMVSRNLLLQSMPLPEGIHHDDWLAFKATTKGGIHYHDEVLTHYRQHQKSTTKTIPQKTTARPVSQRRLDYEKQLRWIALMKSHERENYKDWYQELENAYRKKAGASYNWTLLKFMLKYRSVLFLYSRKSKLSQYMEIVKQCRGEKP